MEFVEFIEYNDNEGEPWRFWLQYDGNEEQLEKLSDLLADSDDYNLHLNVVASESEVETLVRYTQSGYFNYENMVTGKLTTPEPNRNDPDDDPLYKGGIRDYFKENER